MGGSGWPASTPKAQVSVVPSAVEQEHGKVGGVQQAVHVAVERAKNRVGVQVGGDLLADRGQVFERGADLLLHFGAARLGRGQLAVVRAFRLRPLGLELHLHGDGAVGRFLAVDLLARGDGIERHFVGAA